MKSTFANNIIGCQMLDVSLDQLMCQTLPAKPCSHTYAIGIDQYGCTCVCVLNGKPLQTVSFGITPNRTGLLSLCFVNSTFDTDKRQWSVN